MSELLPTLTELHVADEPTAWTAAGFDVGPDGACRIGSVRLCLRPPADGRRGITSWALAHDPGGDLDGLATQPAQPDEAPSPVPPAHPNRVVSIDHVVVLSPDLDRTAAAFEERNVRVRRVRHVDAEQYGFPARQVFFRVGEVVVEVIGPDTPRADADHTSARFYGLAFTVDDIDATAALLGDRVGRVKDAVQPGRRITTLRHKDVGISVATAFMSIGPAAT